MTGHERFRQARDDNIELSLRAIVWVHTETAWSPRYKHAHGAVLLPRHTDRFCDNVSQLIHGDRQCKPQIFGRALQSRKMPIKVV